LEIQEISELNIQACECDLTLFLKGDALQPTLVTAALGSTPTRSHMRGLTWVTSAGTVVTEKTGLWLIALSGDLSELSALVLQLQSIAEAAGLPVLELPGVDVAFIDLLIMVPASAGGGAGCGVVIDAASMTALGRMGLPLELTFAAIVP